MSCNCPKTVSISDIDPNTCPEDLGQFQRIAVVRKGSVRFDTVTPANNLPATITGLDPTTEAPWTILRAASDDSHVVFTPLIGGDPIVEPGEEKIFGGGDNSTLNGAVYHEGFDPSTFSCRYDQLTALQTKQMKELKCEDLEVFFVNDEKKILGQREGDVFRGFDIIGAATLQSRVVNGFGTRNSNQFKFQLKEDWDTVFEKITPVDFNALTF